MRSSRAPSTAWKSYGSAVQHSAQGSHLHYRPRIRSLSTTPSRPAKRRSPYRSITQVELDRIAAARATLRPNYTPEEKQDLARQYTPAQLEAIEVGEAAVNPVDLARAGRRHDVLAPKEADANSYSRMQPTIDKHLSRIQGEWDNYGDNSAYKRYAPDFDEEKNEARLADIILDPSDNPLDDASARMYRPGPKAPKDAKGQKAVQQEEKGPPEPLPPVNLPDNNPGVVLGRLWDKVKYGNPKEIAKYAVRERQPIYGDDGELTASQLDDMEMPNIPGPRKPHGSGMSTADRLSRAMQWASPEEPPEFSPELPRIDDPKVRWDEEGEQEDNSAGDDETAEAYARLAKIMSTTPEQLRRYRTKLLVSHRVVNQTRLGKIAQQYYLCVAGDEKGMLGIGEGKAAESDAGARLARLAAIRNMVPIRRYENRTIYGEVKGKCGAVELTVSSRPPGFGLRVSQHIFEIARCAGLSDLSAKVTRSRNPMNVAKAVWMALRSQKDPEEIARARGKKMVDVRKVYYAGLLS